MTSSSSFKRNYICGMCGKIRRASADYIPEAPPAPQCCDRAMQLLSHEQTVAATQLSETRRVAWLLSGGNVVHRGGKRPWKTVTDRT